ncbi:MAG: hypothetical protein LBS92_02340 [Candidatus Methanoplasma sp.]|nr:hypothetical protein [Candidatus Methanoplasma sp.]
MTNFKLSGIVQDDDICTRKSTVKVGTSGDTFFETPIRSGSRSVKRKSAIFEIYRKIYPATIHKCLNSTDYNTKYCGGLERQLSFGDFNTLIMEYNGKEIPTGPMIAQLADLQYTHTDAIVTPSWYSIVGNTGSSKAERYIELSDKYCEAAMFRNSKPILASIPQSLPPGDIDRVVKFYMDKDITSFIVDSGSRTPNKGTWLRTLLRAVSAYNVEDESLLYSVNAFQGISQKSTKHTEAKDFLGFNVGFDILGGKYVAKGSADYYNRIKTSSETVAKQFHRSTYKYESVSCSADLKVEITNQSTLDQIEEMSAVRMAISEKTGMKNLLESKGVSEKTIKSFTDLKKEVNNKSESSTLDDFI